MNTNRRLRDELAAHAPHDIPDWFKPVLPPLPPLPPVPKLDLPYNHVQGPTDEGKPINVSPIIWASMSRYLKKLQDGEIPDGLDLHYPVLEQQFGMTGEQVDAVYQPFYTSVEPYIHALRARDTVKEQATLGQWPWAYADLVLSYRRTI